jgi:hypothetical protein
MRVLEGVGLGFFMEPFVGLARKAQPLRGRPVNRA